MPSNQSGADQALQGAYGALGNLGATTTGTAVPGFQALYSSLMNNPYYSAYQAGAGATGAEGVQFGQGEINQAYGLQSLGNNLQSYIPGVMATAYDPQSALYNQQAGANQQQANAIYAQEGVGGSPYAASGVAQSNQNFNLNWQNNEQQRQLAGLSAVGQLSQGDAALQSMAGDLGAAGLNTMYQGYAAPYQAYTGNENSIAQMLTQLVSGDVMAGSPYTQAGNLAGNYLNIGQTAYQNELAGWQAQQKANASFWGGIGDLAGMGLDFLGF